MVRIGNERAVVGRVEHAVVVIVGVQAVRGAIAVGVQGAIIGFPIAILVHAVADFDCAGVDGRSVVVAIPGLLGRVAVERVAEAE